MNIHVHMRTVQCTCMPVCITVPLTVIPPLASGAFEPPPTETLIRAAAFDEIACRQRAAWLVWRCLCRFSWCLGGGEGGRGGGWS